METGKSFRIGGLEIRLPIVQGGMGVGISLANLASAVANEGGIGVISSVGIGMLEEYGGGGGSKANIEGLRAELRKARDMTAGVIGVNIMAALSDFGKMLKTALQEQADIIFVGAGLMLKIPEEIDLSFLEKARSKIAPIVSSDRAAKIIFNYWDKHYGHIPDAIVVEGPLAGGHLGFKRTALDDPAITLENILAGVKNVISEFEAKYKKKIPIIAGGGIHDGGDIANILSKGADAAQMGTRFVATEECDASPAFKQSYIDSRPEDIVIIKSPVGLPGRAINCDYLKEVAMGHRKPINCRWKCLHGCDYHTAPYCIARALTNAQQGHLEEGFAFCGANAHKITGLLKVKELIAGLKQEFEAALEKILPGETGS
ncbi:MAG: nitronate monooxygenase [Candidatus Cloacimonetes bacterium]|nr:nitronate monooxygenase [Candidatus Cloacimonadota bacterium]